jgi:four helix bundle protein
MSHVKPTTTRIHSPRPALDHERLEVYRLAVEFHGLVMGLVPRRGVRHIRDQIERSSLSVVLCIAEGAGRSTVKDKRRFYAMARGSATESAAVIDVLLVRGVASAQDCQEARAMAVRLVQMLSRLCAPAR